MGQVINRAALFAIRNPKLGARLKLNVPWWVPNRLASLWDENAGKVGCVVSVDIGEFSDMPMYSVVFEREGEKATMGVYFEDSVTFEPEANAIEGRA